MIEVVSDSNLNQSKFMEKVVAAGSIGFKSRSVKVHRKGGSSWEGQPKETICGKKTMRIAIFENV